MQAIQYSDKGSVGVADLRMPPLQPGHALVKVMASGLCHTDIDVLYGRYGNGTFPLVPGHEFSGVVTAVADDVTGLVEGARVAVDPNMPCGKCRSCLKGRYNLCENLKAYGVTTNGGFAQYAVVDARHLHDIGDLPFHVAALAEPLGCVLNGLSAAGGTDARNALVFGAGPIGLLLALSLKARGVRDVTVADVNEDRLAFAGNLDLTPIMSASGELGKRTRAFDFVADATGVPSVVEGMVALTADGGTALVFGVCAPDAFVRIAPFELFRRQIKIAGSHSLNKNIPDALSVLHGDDGTMEKLVSHRLSFDELLPFFQKGGGSSKTMKVQFSAE